MDEDEAERLEAQRELEAARAKQADMAARTSALVSQASHYKTRVSSLTKGEAALSSGAVGAAGSALPEDALRSYATGRPPRVAQTYGRDPALEQQEQRGAEITMARRKQQLSEQRMRQQMETQTLNDQRLELEQQQQALEDRRAELRKCQIAAAKAAAPPEPPPVARESSTEEVAEEGGLDGKPEEADQVDTAHEGDSPGDAGGGGGGDDDDDDDDPNDVRPLLSAAATRAHYQQTLEAQEAALRARQQAFTMSLAERRGSAGTGGKGYAGELGHQTYRSDQLDTYKAARTLAFELVGEALEQIDDASKPGASEEQLRAEYSNWERSHKQLERRLEREKKEAEARRKAGERSDESVEEEEDSSEEDESKDGEETDGAETGAETADEVEEEEEEEEEYEPVTLAPSKPLPVDNATIRALAVDVLSSLVVEPSVAFRGLPLAFHGLPRPSTGLSLTPRPSTAGAQLPCGRAVEGDV